MDQIDVQIQSRVRNTKNANRRARRAGRLPAIVYGGSDAPAAISVDLSAFEKLLHKAKLATIFNLQGEGPEQKAIIRDLQRDPVTEAPLHVDFYRIQIDKAIVVDVAVHHIGGDPIGVREGGVLETLTRQISVRCLPLEVPTSFDVDLTDLDIGQAIHVSDLTAPAGIEILSAPETTLFIIAAAKVEEEVEEVAEGEEGAAEGEEGAAEGDAAEGGDASGEKS